MLSLTELANKYGTDKGNLHHEAHTYTEVYDFFLNEKRYKKLNFLEIGINDPRFPAASVLMWLEYFGKECNYIGFDINIDQHLLDIEKAHDNCRLFKVDQVNPEQITSALIQCPMLDVVVDDGIHTFEAQINSFFSIFPNVKRGGLYFIEDCHAKDCWKTVELFRNLKRGAADIASIGFYKQDKLIVIEKI